jgi:hypothetical protein
VLFEEVKRSQFEAVNSAEFAAGLATRRLAADKRLRQGVGENQPMG